MFLPKKSHSLSPEKYAELLRNPDKVMEPIVDAIKKANLTDEEADALYGDWIMPLTYNEFRKNQERAIAKVRESYKKLQKSPDRASEGP